MQGSVAPVGGEGGEQFASWVSGIGGDAVRPLLDSVLGGRCMILIVSKATAAACPVLHCFFNTNLNLTTPVEPAQCRRVVRARRSLSAHPGVVVMSNCGLVPQLQLH